MNKTGLLILTLTFLSVLTATAAQKGPLGAEICSENLETSTLNKLEKLWDYTQRLPVAHLDTMVNNRFVARGLPSGASFNVHRLQPKEIASRVWRHYTTIAGLKNILSTHKLVAGPTAFVNSPLIYTDIRGVFLTSESASLNQIGLHSDTPAWVDVKIDGSIPVIYLNGEIFYIPGVPTPPDWMRKTYGNQTEIDPTGAFGPFQIFNWKPTEIPVEIVGASPP